METRTVEDIRDRWEKESAYCYSLDHAGVGVLLAEIARLRATSGGTDVPTKFDVRMIVREELANVEFARRGRGGLELPVMSSTYSVTAQHEVGRQVSSHDLDFGREKYIGGWSSAAMPTMGDQLMTGVKRRFY